MNTCPRCGVRGLSEQFCVDCQRTFNKMIEQLRLAFIHQKGHPEKKTLWVHIDDSKN